MNSVELVCAANITAECDRRLHLRNRTKLIKWTNLINLSKLTKAVNSTKVIKWRNDGGHPLRHGGDVELLIGERMRVPGAIVSKLRHSWHRVGGG